MSKYITMKDYEHIKENARTEAEKIPSGHCRIKKKKSTLLSSVGLEKRKNARKEKLVIFC